MQRILVTGLNGFVGQHLARELLSKGMQVAGVGGPQGADVTVQDGVSYAVVDLLDQEAVKSIDFSDIDGVVHLAGLAAVGPSFDNPKLYMESNTAMEINLFEAAQAQNSKPKFLIISSGSLYDPATSLPITESSAVLPNSPYAVSKLAQEQLGSYYRTRGFEVVIARPFNHIGPGQGLGFIVPDITKQIIDFENVELDKITVGNLDAKRDYTDVRDIARAYSLLLEHGKDGGIYNICSGSSVSGHDLLDTIMTTADAHPEVVVDPARMRPSDTPDIYGSHKKLTADTGWEPRYNLATTIADVVTDWRNRAA